MQSVRAMSPDGFSRMFLVAPFVNCQKRVFAVDSAARFHSISQRSQSGYWTVSLTTRRGSARRR